MVVPDARTRGRVLTIFWRSLGEDGRRNRRAWWAMLPAQFTIAAVLVIEPRFWRKVR
jgi:hypothetical protein